MPRPSWLSWLIGLGACAAGVLLTPERLMMLGAMRQSLTHANEMTRALAQLEISVVRVVLVLMGLAIIFLAPRLQALSRQPRIQPLLVPLPEAHERFQRKAWTSSLFILLAFMCVGIASVYLHAEPPKVSVEDGPMEQFTAYSFFLASIVAFWIVGQRGFTLRSTFLVLMGAFFFFAAGEEISWGQRIFSWESPEVMLKYNVQGETNIHNMFGYLADHLFIAGAFTFGGLLPLVCARWPELLRLLSRLGVPVGTVGLAIGVIAASLIHDWTIGRLGGPWIGFRSAEMREALIGLSFLLLMIETLRMQRLDSADPSLLPRRRAVHTAPHPG
jgi:hypothetical protein